MRDRKAAVEELLALNVHDLSRAGVFKAPHGTLCNCVWSDGSDREVLRVDFWLEGNPAAPSLRLKYVSDNGNSAPTSTRIELGSLRCHLGGAKRMFLCPGKANDCPCGRLVQKLYLVEERWLCRSCGDLTYLARRKHDKRKDRLMRDPLALLAALNSDDVRQRLLGLGAFAEATTRSKKYTRH